MRRFLIAVSLLLVSHTLVAAEADPSLARIRELVKLMEQDAAFRVAVEAILNQQHATGMKQLEQVAVESPEKAPLVEARKKELVELHARVLRLFWKHIDLDGFREEVIVPLYVRHFTDDEVNALLQFYRSPVARKLVGLTPELIRESSGATTRYFAPAVERVREELEGDVKEKAKVLRTKAEMRTISNAIESVQVEIKFKGIDPARLPRLASVDELRPLFEAADVRFTLRSNDGWDRPLVILLSEGGVRYRIVSAGADGVFEADSRTLPEVPPGAATVWTDSRDADIIFGDGYFLRLPSEMRGTEEWVKN